MHSAMSLGAVAKPAGGGPWWGSTAVVSEPHVRFYFHDAAVRPTKPLKHIAFLARQAVDKSTAIPAALALRSR
jgi:hypothetical protein